MAERKRNATVDPKLLDLLACALTKGSLDFNPDENELVSNGAKLAYPVRDGIAVMLPSEARILDDDVPGRKSRKK
ncbi:MAG: Trm112 family protein [Hyphomicrobiales bacterium]|nr:Trm112 family protein [Hyphomicrobiales bacterium]